MQCYMDRSANYTSALFASENYVATSTGPCVILSAFLEYVMHTRRTHYSKEQAINMACEYGESRYLDLVQMYAFNIL